MKSVIDALSIGCLELRNFSNEMSNGNVRSECYGYAITIPGCVARVNIPSRTLSGYVYIPTWADTLLVNISRFPKTSNSRRVEVEACVFYYVVKWT